MIRLNTDCKPSKELTEKANSLIKSYFEKGLSAQSNELPFFMPYESTNKRCAQLNYLNYL